MSFIANPANRDSQHRFIVVDANYIVQYSNPAFCQWVEKEAHELLGYSLINLFFKGNQPDCKAYYYPLLYTVAEKQALTALECYLPVLKKDNWCLVNTYLHQDEAGQVQYAAASYVPIEQYQEMEKKLKVISVSVISSLAKAIDARDHYTGRHSENVAQLMADFAVFRGLPAEEIHLAYLLGKVHDIGKIGVPEAILNKPTWLEDHEFAFIKRHPDIGAAILAEISGFEEIAFVVRSHHERYDGTGYPQGLYGNSIPFLSRMLAICDAYDAMTSVRCYRQSFSVNRAVQEIEKGGGFQFDPELSRKFVNFQLKRNKASNYGA